MALEQQDKVRLHGSPFWLDPQVAEPERFIQLWAQIVDQGLIIPGHGKTKTGCLWVSNIPGGSVFYHWRKGRDQGGVSELFGTPDNDSDSEPSLTHPPPPTVIQCDGFSAYPAWAKGKKHITLMG